MPLSSQSGRTDTHLTSGFHQLHGALLHQAHKQHSPACLYLRQAHCRPAAKIISLDGLCSHGSQYKESDRSIRLLQCLLSPAEALCPAIWSLNGHHAVNPEKGLGSPADTAGGSESQTQQVLPHCKGKVVFSPSALTSHTCTNCTASF